MTKRAAKNGKLAGVRHFFFDLSFKKLLVLLMSYLFVQSDRDEVTNRNNRSSSSFVLPFFLLYPSFLNCRTAPTAEVHHKWAMSKRCRKIKVQKRPSQYFLLITWIW
uniref:Uncharacterized protein n=1 Tax=Anguilla anguilla TaxID=7936 RepID=A0A0E9RA50_ANGAN